MFLGLLSSKKKDALICEVLHQNFGDLTFDLFYSILWSRRGAETLYLRFWRKLEGNLRNNTVEYEKYARAWVLQTAVELLMQHQPKLGRSPSPSERVMVDSNLNVPARLRSLESYLHRLPIQDQILLNLRNKYGLPYPEIASILRLPEGTLRTKQQQALRSLEEWLWDQQ